jgi:electron transport complex protein RnfD
MMPDKAVTPAVGLQTASGHQSTGGPISPVSRKSRIIFGVGCGIITSVIKKSGGLSDGVCYSNAVAPLVDRFVKSRPYGFRKVVKNAA